jgi:cobalt-zinc-cadmium efflux system membrane fusion protein
VSSHEVLSSARACLAAGVLSIFLAGCSNGPVAETAVPAPPEEQDVVRIDSSAVTGGKVKWEAARLEALPQLLQVTGRAGVDENRTSRVGSIVDGRVIAVLANVGDRVEKGRLLARLHSHEVHDARAEYAKARNELRRREAECDYSRNARDRAARLYQLKATSLEQLQRTEADLKSAELGIKTAQAEINRIGEHLHHLGLSYEGAEEEYTREGNPGEYEDEELVPVVAPISGTILKRFVSPGTVVTPASDLLLISDLETLWIHAEVPEKFLGLVRQCKSAAVKVQAYPERVFTARVEMIGDLLNPDTRTVEVRCSIRNSEGLLKPEMYAAVTFEFSETRQSVVIPIASVQDLGGQSVVFVREDDTRFRSRTVRLGRQTGDLVEVLEGVKAGESVVSQGSFLLKSELLKRQMAGD